jgi:hypothetical protein
LHHCEEVDLATQELQEPVETNKEEEDAYSSTIEDSFVIYDPDNLPFERLYLCEYLRELPDLEEEDDP